MTLIQARYHVFKLDSKIDHHVIPRNHTFVSMLVSILTFSTMSSKSLKGPSKALILNDDQHIVVTELINHPVQI
ncbi:MAG: hypothetical protein PSN37_00360 [Alphaproteobacteria bacterium]|nr:hypothetical protein [Alphaproteobacteria bacterium]